MCNRQLTRARVDVIDEQEHTYRHVYCCGMLTDCTVVVTLGFSDFMPCAIMLRTPIDLGPIPRLRSACVALAHIPHQTKPHLYC